MLHNVEYYREYKLQNLKSRRLKLSCPRPALFWPVDSFSSELNSRHYCFSAHAQTCCTLHAEIIQRDREEKLSNDGTQRMVNKDKAAWHCKVYEAVVPIKLQNYALISLSQSSHHARASAALENCCICSIYLSHLDYITTHTAYCIEVAQIHSDWLACTQEGVI